MYVPGFNLCKSSPYDGSRVKGRRSDFCDHGNPSVWTNGFFFSVLRK